MKTFGRTIVLAFALILCSSLAHAADGVDRPISVTVSPLLLILPVFEVTAEYAVMPDLGVAGILGIGQVSVESSLGDDSQFTVFEIGGSVRYYAIGSFRHGMQLGLEALYLQVSGSMDNAIGVGKGLSVGPFIGYKYIASFGLTVDLQGGVGYTLLGAEASNDQGDSASNSDSQLLPILNINLGWSF